jgi:hypothetical protein
MPSYTSIVSDKFIIIIAVIDGENRCVTAATLILLSILIALIVGVCGDLSVMQSSISEQSLRRCLIRSVLLINVVLQVYAKQMPHLGILKLYLKKLQAGVGTK